MNTSTTNLLRRTAVALAAVAGFYVADSSAAVVTLSGVNGNTCTYSSMSVAPDGGFTVACQGGGGTPPPPVPGTLGLGAQADVTVGTPVTINAFRSSGSSGVVGASYSVSGTGCAAGSGTVSWADADAGSKPIAVTTTAAGTCSVALSNATGGASLGTASISFNVTAVQPAPSNCPTGFTAPADMISAQLGGVGNPLLAMAKSGQVTSITLPATAAGYSTGQIALGESAGGAYTPQPVTLNITISKCKGLIDTDQSNRCNIQSTNGNYNSITWFSQAYSIIRDANSAGLRGYCWAPASEGPWYFNAKWTYSQCAFGAQTCGFAVQQNYGPY